MCVIIRLSKIAWLCWVTFGWSAPHRPLRATAPGYHLITWQEQQHMEQLMLLKSLTFFYCFLGVNQCPMHDMLIGFFFARQDCRLQGLFVSLCMSISTTHGIGFWMLTVTGYVITLGHMVVARLQESLDLFECDKEWRVPFIQNLNPRFGRMPGWDLEVKTLLTALILMFTHSSDYVPNVLLACWQIESTIETMQAFLRK